MDRKYNKSIGEIMQPIKQPNKRAKDTNAAIPSRENVKEAKDWVDFNKK